MNRTLGYLRASQYKTDSMLYMYSLLSSPMAPASFRLSVRKWIKRRKGVDGTKWKELRDGLTYSTRLSGLFTDTDMYRLPSTNISRLQADLDKLFLWAQKWQMVFNVDKCKVMHVGNWEDSRTYYGSSYLL